jgi:hypothetical protein
MYKFNISSCLYKKHFGNYIFELVIICFNLILFLFFFFFRCSCDIPWAWDIESEIPINIYTPAPTTSSFAAAFGGQVPESAAAYM